MLPFQVSPWANILGTGKICMRLFFPTHMMIGMLGTWYIEVYMLCDTESVWGLLVGKMKSKPQLAHFSANN